MRACGLGSELLSDAQQVDYVDDDAGIQEWQLKFVSASEIDTHVYIQKKQYMVDL